MTKGKISRIGLVVFCIVVTLLCSGSIHVYATSMQGKPDVKLSVAGQSFAPQKSVWNLSVLKGLFYVKQEKNTGGEPYDLGNVSGGKLPITNSLQYPMTITVQSDTGETVFQGGEKEYGEFALTKNGAYQLKVVVFLEKAEKKDYGSFHFDFKENLTLKPKLLKGNTKVVQGDVLALKLTDLSEGITPTVTTQLGRTVFIKKDGYFQAFVPVGYLQKIGKYPVTVRAGSFTETFEVEVAAGTFNKQYMTINKKNKVIAEASSAKAYQQFRDIIYPLYETADPTVYWKGQFIQPVKGRISTEFGLYRYTNGSKTPARHSGIDIAAAKGTPVLSPAAGVVVYSGYILNTGNTLAIEHGGGLKSYFYHMDSLKVKAGDRVEPGRTIGLVGTTGYSTGPHLHYEVRLGKHSLNPWNLFRGTGGFFPNSLQ